MADIYNIYQFNKKNILDTLSKSRDNGEHCLVVLEQCDRHIKDLNAFVKQSKRFYKQYNKNKK